MPLLISDHVYQWRLLLEEFGPKIMHMKGIHNANANSRLDFGPVQDNKANWMMLTKCWCHYTMHAHSTDKSTPHEQLFANCNKEDVIYPLTGKEIAPAQKMI